MCHDWLQILCTWLSSLYAGSSALSRVWKFYRFFLCTSLVNFCCIYKLIIFLQWLQWCTDVKLSLSCWCLNGVELGYCQWDRVVWNTLKCDTSNDTGPPPDDYFHPPHHDDHVVDHDQPGKEGHKHAGHDEQLLRLHLARLSLSSDLVCCFHQLSSSVSAVIKCLSCHQVSQMSSSVIHYSSCHKLWSIVAICNRLCSFVVYPVVYK